MVKLDVYDINGRAVSEGTTHASSLQGTWHRPGVNQITFDGSELSSGIYIYRLTAGDYSAAEKILLLK